MKVTIITMYRGHDAEIFVQAVEGELTAAQKDQWQKAHSCDSHFVGDEDDKNSMFFRVLTPLNGSETHSLMNVDQANYPG